MKTLLWGVSIVFLTLLGYWLLPGHTYLQSDTQIYIPMLEHLRDPALYPRDIVALRPHLTFTIYDETALALRRITGSDFQTVLTAEQLVFRALAICGLILIALRLGLNAVQSFFVAAVVSLGATIVGAAVLTVEYEPVPRGFAIALIVFALGLIAHERYAAAGIAASIAFLYHPPTTLPFWGLVALLVIARRLRWTILAPVATAALILAILARFQPHGAETSSMLQRLDPFQENLQHMRAAYSFVSSWNFRLYLDFAVQAMIGALAFRRLRTHLPTPLRDFLWGLPVIGILCVPLSWILLEREHWALIPEWQPARAILFVSLMTALLSAVAALKTTGFVERAIWLTAAFLMPIQHLMLGREVHLWPLALAVALAILATLAGAIRQEALVLAVIPLLLIPRFLVVNTDWERDIQPAADWARASTPQPSLFLFPDSGTSLAPGVFRARALRGLYVDWKSGGQVNYFPDFSREWWRRWVETGSGRWQRHSAGFSETRSDGRRLRGAEAAGIRRNTRLLQRQLLGICDYFFSRFPMMRFAK